MKNNKLGKYLKYAVGEILLVVIGILIALQINNWNENRKADALAHDTYLSLLASLEQDLAKVVRTIKLNQIGLDALGKIIPIERNQDLLDLSEENLNNYLIEVTLSSRSFIPNSGIYNLLTSNNGFDLVKSEKIKYLLINLYDYQYRSYMDLDLQIDTKYHNQLGSILKEKVGIILQYTPELSVVQSASPELFRQNYFEIAAESRDLYGMLAFNINDLMNLEHSIEELISIIRDEIE